MSLHLRPSPSVTRIDVEGGLLLFETGGNRLFAFNETARVAWDLVASGQSGEALVGDFASAWNIPVPRARDDIRHILIEWCDTGLLLTDAAADHATSDRAPSGEAIRTDPLPPPGPVKAWTCTIRERVIAFAIEGEAAAVVYPMFKHLRTPDGVPDVRFEIRNVDRDRQALFENGRERLTTADPAQLIGAIWQAVVESIHPEVDWLALIHGGAVGRDGVATGLCGPSGSGKSTLVASLTHAGFDYLADDMITLSAPDARIVPLPLPLSIKPGGLRALAPTHPGLAETEVFQTKGLDARLLVPDAAVWTIDPMPMRTLIFPRFTPDRPASTRALTTFEAIERLLKERIWLGHPMTPPRIAAFVAWISSTPCHAITFETVEDSIRLVEDILR